MKKFRFTLQTVHDLRMRTREEAEREFARATHNLNEARAQLQEAVRQREQAVDAYATLLYSGKFDAQEAALQTDYLRALTQLEIEQRARIQTLEEEVAAKRDMVARAARDAEATASLREQHHARHLAEAARHEQSMLDEMATLSVARRHIGNL